MSMLSDNSNTVSVRNLADGELDHVAGGDCVELPDGSFLCTDCDPYTGECVTDRYFPA